TKSFGRYHYECSTPSTLSSCFFSEVEIRNFVRISLFYEISSIHVPARSFGTELFILPDVDKEKHTIMNKVIEKQHLALN
ncbi:hypothetical protein A0J61_05148, partial [Choanephora cucurbitarum]